MTTNYGYDAIYELLSATQGSAAKESYNYDPVGNRLSSLGVNPYSYNVSNELTSTAGGSYIYDNNGNTLTDPSGKTYTWDFENRLKQVTLPGSRGTVAFKYDPFGRRILKSSSSGTSVYAYDGANVIEETDANGTVVARYAQGMGIDEPLAMLRGGATSFYNADGLGSITSLANGAGTLAQTYTYDSFGKQMASSGSLTNPFQYTGREFDPETGLYYYRARYYNPSIGRFISEDPIGLWGGVNFYGYTRNNPLRYRDPFGLITRLITTYDSGFGSHSALQISNKNGDWLYDPGGSYKNGERGEDGTFEGKDAGLRQYIDYQRSTGSDVSITTLRTTQQEEDAIQRRAEDQGDPGPFFCASATSYAVGGTCGVGSSVFPGNLRKDAERSTCTSRHGASGSW